MANLFRRGLNSPIYVKVTNTAMDFCVLNLHIYQGNYNPDPDFEYVLRKDKITGNDFVIFEISELAGDFVTQNLTSSGITQGLQSQAQCWIEILAQPQDTLGTLGPSDEVQIILLGYSATGYFTDGYKLDSKTAGNTTAVLSGYEPPLVPSTTTIKQNGNDDIPVALIGPFNNGQGDNFNGIDSVEFRDATGTALQTNTIGNASNTNSAYRYITFSGQGVVKQVAFIDGNTTIQVPVEQVECDKFIPIPLIFENKNGALQQTYFEKKSIETRTMQRDTYKGNTLLNTANYDQQTHQVKTLSVDSNRSIVLNSGYENEDFATIMEQILSTQFCWIYYERKWLPVVPDENAVVVKTVLNDRLIQYSLKLNFAFDRINTIR